MRKLAVLVVVVVAGCDNHTTLSTDPSRGEMGRAELAWDHGALGCLFGCDASAPMAARARATLLVLNDEELPALTVSSEDPAVAEFSYQSGGYVGVDSHAAGRVRLVLSDAATGETIDRFAIEVHDVAAIEAYRPEHLGRVLVMSGGGVILSLTLRDADDEAMVGVGGVDYALEGGLTEAQVGLAEAIADAFAQALVGASEELDLLVADTGEGNVRVTAPSGATLSLPFAVVGPEVVSEVTVTAPDGLDVGWSSNFQANAYATGHERVHSPLCAWELTEIQGGVELSSMSRDTLWVTSSAPGSAVGRCTINGVIGQATVVVADQP